MIIFTLGPLVLLIYATAVIMGILREQPPNLMNDSPASPRKKLLDSLFAGFLIFFAYILSLCAFRLTLEDGLMKYSLYAFVAYCVFCLLTFVEQKER